MPGSARGRLPRPATAGRSGPDSVSGDASRDRRGAARAHERFLAGDESCRDGTDVSHWSYRACRGPAKRAVDEQDEDEQQQHRGGAVAAGDEAVLAAADAG